MHVVVHLLKNRSEERPSFSDIKEYIESEIQMQSAKNWAAEPLSPDSEDFPS